MNWLVAVFVMLAFCYFLTALNESRLTRKRNALARLLANCPWQVVDTAVRSYNCGRDGQALFWDGESFTFRRGEWGLEEIGMLLGSILHNDPSRPHGKAADYLVKNFRPGEIDFIAQVIGRRHRKDFDELNRCLVVAFFETTTADESASN